MKDATSLMLRLPADVKAWLFEQAERNERSQNGQMVWLLRQAMAQQQTVEAAAHNARMYGGERGTQAPGDAT